MRMIAVTKSATCYFPITEEEYEKLQNSDTYIYDWIASEEYWRDERLDYRTELTWEDSEDE